MKFLIMLLVLLCNCMVTGRNWYITEINKENKNECIEIIKERPYKKGLFKKVVYRVKEECREKYKKKESIQW